MLKLHEGRCRLAEAAPPRALPRLDVGRLARAIWEMLSEESVQILEKLMKQIMEKRVLHIMRTGGGSRLPIS